MSNNDQNFTTPGYDDLSSDTELPDFGDVNADLYINENGDFDLPQETLFDDISDDSRTLEEIHISIDDLGNTNNKRALIDEACRKLSNAKDLPFVSEIFGDPESRELFLKTQMQILPPPTPLQSEIIALTFQPNIDPPPMIDNMSQAADYIKSKSEKYKPTDDQLIRAQNISNYLKKPIPRINLLRSDFLENWIRDTENER
jgi:hypothetical protein